MSAEVGTTQARQPFSPQGGLAAGPISGLAGVEGRKTRGIVLGQRRLGIGGDRQANVGHLSWGPGGGGWKLH